MSSDDDWFEQAVDEDESDDEPDEDEPDETVEPAESEPVNEEPNDDWDEWGDGTAGDVEDESDPGGGTDGGNGDGTGNSDVADDGDDGGLFEDDFASALDETGGPDAPAGGGSGSGEDFGMGDRAGGGDFGMGGGVGEGSDDIGPGEGFGMGNLGPGGQGFDEEDLDSDIDRIELGIEGLDAMIQGGIPKRSLMVTIGSAGTGKTTFGLQFLSQGLRNGERGVFIALEESRESIIESAVEKGMPFDEYVADEELAIVDIDPVEMANSLKNIQSELPGLVQEFGASRLVLDSVSLLEMMYQDRARRRNEIYDFTRSLKNAGITTLLVSEASDDNPFASRYGIVEYLTDAVFVLQYVRPSDFRETRLAVEIQKIRDANHSRETKPYDITDEGIDVYRQANIF